MNKFITLAVVAAIASCATPPQEDMVAIVAKSTPPSSALRAQIAEAARDFLIDPYSVRDAEISNVGTFSTGTQGVCVKANAKNRSGGYTGREVMGITFKGGVLTGTYPRHPYCNAADLKWHRFNELEALKNL